MESAGAGFDQRADDRVAERIVGRAFGVPLHAEVEPALGVVDGFDDAVVRTGRDGEGARGVHGLAVLGVHGAGGERRVRRGEHFVFACPVVGVRGCGLGHVLVESAAGEQGHHLHAEAHAEDGLVGRVALESFEELGFERLAFLVDPHGSGVGGLAEGLGDRVIAAGEDEGVERVYAVFEAVRRHGEDHGDTAGACDGVGVVPRRGEADEAVVLDQVGGDGDEWWARHGVVRCYRRCGRGRVSMGA